MTKKITLIVGSLSMGLVLVGIALPNIGGLHLTPLHNLIIFTFSATLLFASFKLSSQALTKTALIIGTLYLLLGAAGFILGNTKTNDTLLEADADKVIFVPPLAPDERWLRIIPNKFEIGTPDHVLHLSLGALLLIGAFSSPRKKEIQK